MVRFKNRYFVAEIDLKDQPSRAPFLIKSVTLQAIILDRIHQIHGDFGLASVTTGFRIKYCNPYTKILMIRCRHGPHRFVATVLPIIRNIKGTNVQFNMLYLGATMMKCFKFIKNHQLTTLEKFWNQMKSNEDRDRFKEAILKPVVFCFRQIGHYEFRAQAEGSYPYEVYISDLSN